MRLRLPGFCLAAVAALLAAHTSMAKPPDLPENTPIIVAPDAVPPQVPSLPPCPVGQRMPTWFEFDPAPAFVDEPLVAAALFLQLHPFVALLPHEMMVVQADGNGCPFQPMIQSVRQLVQTGKTPTVLENLQALNRAAEVLRKAEKQVKRGQTGQAARLAQQARDLVPWSSIAERAEEMLQQLAKAEQIPAIASGTEEAEVTGTGDMACCPWMIRLSQMGHCKLCDVFAWCEKMEQSAPTPVTNEFAEMVVGSGMQAGLVLADCLCRKCFVLPLPVPQVINVYSADPEVRVGQLIAVQEMQQVEQDWLSFWLNDTPTHLTTGTTPRLMVAVCGCQPGAKVEDRLQQRTTLRCQGATVGEVLHHLQQTSGVPIIVSEGVCLKQPVSLAVEQMPVQSVIEVLVRPVGLELCVKNGAACVCTAQRCCPGGEETCTVVKTGCCQGQTTFATAQHKKGCPGGVCKTQGSTVCGQAGTCSVTVKCVPCTSACPQACCVAEKGKVAACCKGANAVCTKSTAACCAASTCCAAKAKVTACPCKQVKECCCVEKTTCACTQVKECCCAQKTACACTQVKECCCVEKNACSCSKAKACCAAEKVACPCKQAKECCSTEKVVCGCEKACCAAEKGSCPCKQAKECCCVEKTACPCKQVKECCCAQKTACACKQVKECCCVEKTTCPCVKAKEVAACSCSKKAGSACCAAGCEGSCAGKCEECAQVKSVEKKAARTEKQARKAEKQARKAEKQARKARKVSRRESTRGVEEQVTGLLKACYHAVQNEHYEKAADLARQAYALDARRVEGDPVVYKFSLIETCAARRIASPTPECPAVTASNNYPTPVVTHVFVPAYTVTVGEDGLERIGVDFSVPGVQVHSDSGVIGEVMPEEGSFCTTLLKAVAPESCLDAASYLVNLFVPSMLLPDEVDNGSITFGLSTSGDINFQGLAKYKGMVYRAVIHNGFFFAWTTPQPEVE